MNFYEQELKKIVGDRYPDATYVGRACYVRLSDTNRAKIQFVTGIVANHYNALQLTILNRNEGQVDVLRLRICWERSRRTTQTSATVSILISGTAATVCIGMSISPPVKTMIRWATRYRIIWRSFRSRYRQTSSPGSRRCEKGFKDALAY